jgi:hypothetical protein
MGRRRRRGWRRWYLKVTEAWEMHVWESGHARSIAGDVEPKTVDCFVYIREISGSSR